MDNSWRNAFLITLGWSAHKQKKAEQEHQAFLTEQRDCLVTAMMDLQEVIDQVVTECGPIGLSADFVEKMKLVPLYAIGEVLSAQGIVCPEQEIFLKIWITNINPMYNYAQFTQATIQRTGIYNDFQSITGLEKDMCGSFWFIFFELIYRSRLSDMMQKLIDQLGKIIWHFSLLSNNDAPFAEPIYSRIVTCFNFWINAYQQTPYIHALMLLQKTLFDKSGIPIETQLLLREADIEQDNRDFFVFSVFEKVSNRFQGKFAIKALKVINGELDFEHDTDKILFWQEAVHGFELFYEE